MFGWLGGLVAGHEVETALGTAVALAWLIGEYLARRSTWKQGAPKRPPTSMDRGTYPIIAVGVVTGLVADLLGFLSGLGGYLPTALSIAGVVVAGAGLAIRGWALRTLGRFFTMPITIAPDHRIVRGGPYRWIRHPSYTGGFLTALGLALALGTIAGLVVTFVSLTAVYVYRIQREEAALVARFGEEYRRYASETYRMLPILY